MTLSPPPHECSTTNRWLLRSSHASASLVDSSSLVRQHDITSYSVTSGNGAAWKDYQEGLGRKEWDWEKEGEIKTMFKGSQTEELESLCSTLKVSQKGNSRASPECSPSSFLWSLLLLSAGPSCSEC